ncbi:MAG: glycosyltransferase [Acidobacteria bacterium]|nr:glycosyltransferase [Acidobacteriota bacterium]
MRGQDIICFANDWESEPLSKKHIMLRLARENRVLWVNSLGTRTPRASARDLRRMVDKLRQFCRGCQRPARNLYVVSPLAIPFHGSRLSRRINRWWLAYWLRRICRELGFENPISWSFIPSAADIVGTLGERCVIYHCVDEFSEFTGTNKAAILEMERRLIEKADVVLVSSGPLYQSKRPYHPHTFLVTHGVDAEHFSSARDPQTVVPGAVAAFSHPVVGFHGLVADWVDLELVRFLALRRPGWSFVLVGKIETDPAPVDGLPNVHLLGRVDYRYLPAYCKGFDVAILPFVLNDLTRAANPLKLREYLAAGLPVVATPIPEVERLAGAVRIGRNPEEFLVQIEAALADAKIRPAPSLRAVDCESWDEKVRTIASILARVKPELADSCGHPGSRTGVRKSA